MEIQQKDPIQKLIEFYVKELSDEIIYNQDSSGFWDKASTYVFDLSIASFRESLTDFVQGMREDKDMYNYFANMCFRIFSQPFTKTALASFTNSFNEVANDNVFDGTLNYTAKDLSNVESLILFFTVHRNEIMIKMYELKEIINLEAKASKGRK